MCVPRLIEYNTECYGTYPRPSKIIRVSYVCIFFLRNRILRHIDSPMHYMEHDWSYSLLTVLSITALDVVLHSESVAYRSQ